ncbi:hypothetical protein J3E72DRAFT_265885 [Bipolaris maydis]|nr:hypothetical protein J3E72DRAFT_265885 [Bipolaris maydis]
MGYPPDLTRCHPSMPLVVGMPVPRILGIAVLTLAAPPQVLILSEIFLQSFRKIFKGLNKMNMFRFVIMFELPKRWFWRSVYDKTHGWKTSLLENGNPRQSKSTHRGYDAEFEQTGWSSWDPGGS